MCLGHLFSFQMSKMSKMTKFWKHVEISRMSPDVLLDMKMNIRCSLMLLSLFSLCWRTFFETSKVAHFCVCLLCSCGASVPSLPVSFTFLYSFIIFRYMVRSILLQDDMVGANMENLAFNWKVFQRTFDSIFEKCFGHIWQIWGITMLESTHCTFSFC